MSPLLLAAEAGASQTPEVVSFWILAVVAVGSGVAVVALRNIIHGALMLVLNLVAIAGMFLLLQTAFLSVVQIVVYAGAIVVLFLFVIMLLGVDRDDLLPEVGTWHRIGAIAMAVAVLGGVLWAFVGPFTSQASVCGEAATAAEPATGEAEEAGEAGGTEGAEGAESTEGAEGPSVEEVFARSLRDDVRCVGLDAALAAGEHGSVGFVAERLFNRHTFPFELAGLLLTVATIGAIVLGRRKDPQSDAQPGEPEPTGVPGGSVGTPTAPAPGQQGGRGGTGLGSGDVEKGRDAGPTAPGAEDF